MKNCDEQIYGVFVRHHKNSATPHSLLLRLANIVVVHETKLLRYTRQGGLAGDQIIVAQTSKQ